MCLLFIVELVVKNMPANSGDLRDSGLIPGLGRSCGEEKGKPTPVFLPAVSHGQRSLVYSPRGHKESDTARRLRIHIHIPSRIFVPLLFFFQ